MDLYFSPMACSLATRITLYEANADAGFIQVNTKKKRVADGTDFYQVSPLGQVPVLRTNDGWLLTENTAILPYVADQFPHAHLIAPAGTVERAKVQQWLGFISTELHKAVFVPLLDPAASEEVLNYSRRRVPLRLGVLDTHFAANAFLVDRFTVADAYLATVLNWAQYSGLSLAEWPAVDAYFRRMAQRPAVAKAFAEEMALYLEEQAREKAAA
ncbi:glutathione binding-like protein [Paraburkholderia saeva]|jgi:glutathione S-transferase|uniref:Glutathione S-transferase GstA n=1 Tax=Paraburkholderia saeva TaxID=2777537 RepID=A0A9N8RUN0_9BURK|nr:glutathione binding-like protein [Paraburkholderia saeva]CAG4891659.1 Glutathione S-transferase GstA [Paraburkholderia saeva]CAG4895057.1 Glutathione S-transferase GstA [Paraburkholderia saeva]CAG4905369.1 Glutathione S-transferase GstA [Paraburkholderia saeva]